jgi:hypothetical protein
LADGIVIGRHRWQGCETWQGQFEIPVDLVEVGWNELTFAFGHSARPALISGGDNPDNRLLAVGFNRLEVVR